MRCKLIVFGGLIAALAGGPAPGSADLVNVANAIRQDGCGQHAAADGLLRAVPRLDDAARRIAGGDGLESAVSSSGYRAKRATSIHIRLRRGDEDVGRYLARKFCASISDSGLQDIGVHQRDGEAWMVLATPFAPADPAAAAATGRRVVELINAARSKARPCGRRRFPAVAPLGQVEALDRAALEHARDMVTHDFMGHGGSDGSQPADRVTRAGYAWQAVAENVAAGQATAQEVVDTWLASAGHCRNLMSPKYSDTGVAFAVDLGSDRGIYWVQVFAAGK